MAEARAWLNDRYGKSKRAPMYIDTPSGAKRVGYVIGFRAADWSHAPVEKWLQQDWVEFREVSLMDLNREASNHARFELTVPHIEFEYQEGEE